MGHDRSMGHEFTAGTVRTPTIIGAEPIQRIGGPRELANRRRSVSHQTCQGLRQNIRDGDASDDGAIDNDGHILSGIEELARIVAGRAGVGIDFDAAIDQIHDPVHGDTAVGVGILFFTLIAVNSGFGDFHYERDVTLARESGLDNHRANL